MSLVDRAKNIITSPKSEWEVVASESADMGGVLTGYVLPMAAIPAVASIIGALIFSGSIMAGIATAIMTYVVSIIAVLLTAFVVNILADSFNSEKDMGRATQLVAYSYTPMWIGGVLNIIPFLAPIGILFGLYGLYLLYLGLPHTMKTPQEKVVIYLIVTIVVLFVIYMVLGLVIGGILAAIFGAAILGAAGAF